MVNQSSIIKLKEPYVIGAIIMVVCLIVYLVMAPIISSEKEPGSNVRITKTTGNLKSLKSLPETYADIKIQPSVAPENVPVLVHDPIKELPVIIPKSQSPHPTMHPRKKELTEFEKAVQSGRNSSISFPSFKPIQKNPKPTDKHDNHALKMSVEKPGSRLMIQAGTVLNATLITGINSDLPGHAIAIVNRNIYDTVHGSSLLIPQGSKLMGTYSSSVKMNQKRVQASWDQIKLPNGDSINLRKKMPGVGSQGISGLSGTVNNHYISNMFSIFSVALLNSSAKRINGLSSGDFDDEVSGDMAEDVADAGTDIFKKQIQLGPSIEIPLGSTINVLVTNDLYFERPYRHE